MAVDKAVSGGVNMELLGPLFDTVLSQTGLIAGVLFFFWWQERTERLNDKKEFTQIMKEIATQISGNTTALSLIKEKISMAKSE